MKKDRMWKVLLPVTVILVLAVMLLLSRQGTREEQPRETGVPSQTATVPTTPPTVPTEQTTVPTEPVETTVPTEPTETTVPPTEATRPTEPPVTEPPQETEPPVTEPSQETERLTFPYRIPGTDLLLTKVSPYDGVFLEDGQDAQISGVCAIVVQNAGNRDLEYAEVTLVQGERTLYFRISGLTAGSGVLAMEYDGNAYEPGDYDSCTAAVSMVDTFELSPELVQVTEAENGGLTVTNISGEDIPCVRIFYKFYMNDVDVYVGGITYTAKLVDLKAGASQHIQPSHYLVGMSKIIMIKTYDTAE